MSDFELVLRRIVGKVIVSILRDDIISSIGPLQVCAGQEPGWEAAIDAMYEMYKEHSEAVLLLDAANAFNSVNWKVFLHKINVIFPSISIYTLLLYETVIHYYPFIYHWRDRDRTFSEGITQDDPVTMWIYA